MAEVILGFLTFTGSLMAAGKLQEIIPTRPITYTRPKRDQLLAASAWRSWPGVLLVLSSRPGGCCFPLIILLSLAFGVLLIIPIGGADMPTVIALVECLRRPVGRGDGLRAGQQAVDRRRGPGRLVGPDPLDHHVPGDEPLLRQRALRGLRPGAGRRGGRVEQRTVKSATAEEAAQIMEAARTVVIIPGYGMAVAQAQHRVRELYDALTKRGVEVKFAVHPVAGRMPGHMNVLLAEAEIPYDKLIEMEEINPEMPEADVALVLGANDVVNPAARHDKCSPIYGMPIIDADKAKTVFVIKRSMNPGFAGIENELFYADNTLMLFGDAKAMLTSIVQTMKE